MKYNVWIYTNRCKYDLYHQELLTLIYLQIASSWIKLFLLYNVFILLSLLSDRPKNEILPATNPSKKVLQLIFKLVKAQGS